MLTRKPYLYREMALEGLKKLKESVPGQLPAHGELHEDEEALEASPTFGSEIPTGGLRRPDGSTIEDSPLTAKVPSNSRYAF